MESVTKARESSKTRLMSFATWWTEADKSSIVLIGYVTEVNELLEAGIAAIASWPYGEPRVE